MNGYVVENKWTGLQYLNGINVITTLLTILAFGLDDFSGTARVHVANLTHTIHVILHRRITGLAFPSHWQCNVLETKSIHLNWIYTGWHLLTFID